MGTRPLTIGDFSRAVARALSDHADAAGVSQSAIARETGISQTRVNLIMRGERAITVEETALICEALGTPMLTVIREAEQSLDEQKATVLEMPTTQAAQEEVDDGSLAHPELTTDIVAPLSPSGGVFEVYDGSQPPERSAAQVGSVGAEQGTPDDLGEESQIPPEDWDD